MPVLPEGSFKAAFLYRNGAAVKSGRNERPERRDVLTRS